MLDQIQEHLEAIYGFRCEYRASEFLVDGEAARQLGGTGRATEELLVAESHDGVELALYVDPTILARLAPLASHPVALLQHELGAFCEATEGVSHFVYLAQSIGLAREVSMLELEAQAEVDKFVTCSLLRWGADVGSWARALLGLLFDRVHYRETLSAEERWRYEEANRLAKTYCVRLARRMSEGRLDVVLAHLREVYRMGSGAKLALFGAGG